jgi:hypothetical protein
MARVRDPKAVKRRDQTYILISIESKPAEGLIRTWRNELSIMHATTIADCAPSMTSIGRPAMIRILLFLIFGRVVDLGDSQGGAEKQRGQQHATAKKRSKQPASHLDLLPFCIFGVILRFRL